MGGLLDIGHRGRIFSVACLQHPCVPPFSLPEKGAVRQSAEATISLSAPLRKMRWKMLLKPAFQMFLPSKILEKAWFCHVKLDQTVLQ